MPVCLRQKTDLFAIPNCRRIFSRDCLAVEKRYGAAIPNLSKVSVSNLFLKIIDGRAI